MKNISIEDERRVLKEARQSLNKENDDLKKELHSANQSLSKYKNTLNLLIREYEDLTKKYVKEKIRVLELSNLTIENSTEILYKVDDLKASKNKGELDVVNFLKEIDKIFNELKT